MNSYSEIDGAAGGGRRGPAHRRAARRVGLRGHRGLGLLGDRRSSQIMHRVAGRLRRGGRAGPRGRHRRRAAARALLRASRSPTLVRAGTRGGGARRPRRAARAAPEGRARAARRRTGRPSRPPWPRARLDIDPPAHRALARELAEASIVLLDNDGALPLARGRAAVALVGPCADDPLAFLGCYSYPNHGVMAGPPGLGLGIEVPTLLDALRAELPGRHARARAGLPGQGARPLGPRRRRPTRPARPTSASPWSGDRPGLFGRGTSGEGCDAEDLSLPGVQDELRRGAARDGHAGRARGRLRAAVRARALRGPAGRRRPGVPPRRGGRARRSPACSPGASRRRASCPCRSRAAPAAQPSTYLHPVLGGNSGGREQPRPDAAVPLRSRPARTRPSSYADFALGAEEIPIDGEVEVSLRRAQRRATARAPRSSSSTSPTRWRRSRGR